MINCYGIVINYADGTRELFTEKHGSYVYENYKLAHRVFARKVNEINKYQGTYAITGDQLELVNLNEVEK